MTRKNEIEARIIGETSAGMTAIEIYENGELVYSAEYFIHGATSESYQRGLRDIFDDAVSCEDWASYETQDDEPVFYDTTVTTHVIATYKPNSGWEVEHPENFGRDGQSYDWIKANRDRLPEDAVAAWDLYYS